jgi:hypothetical protein
MATAVLAATILFVGTPHRGRIPGWWAGPLLQLVLLGVRAWNEVPESSYGVIQQGQDELHPFTPRAPS